MTNTGEQIDKLKKLVDTIEVCMFCTLDDSYVVNSRPMQTVHVDDAGDIWFFTNEYSPKVAQISKDNYVSLIYAHPGKNSYLHVKGTCTVLEDQQKIKELWKPIYKAWFTEGENDPKLCLLKVDTTEAAYWDGPSNKLVVFYEAIKAILTNETFDKSDTGKITLPE